MTHPPEWHDRRRAGIGSSDIAGILGLSPWATPYSVWCEKMGGPGGGGKPERVRWGSLLEDAIAEESARRLDVTIRGRNVYVVHREHDWARAEIDVVTETPGIDAIGILEIKTTGEDRWREIPAYYRAQVQWQMAVADVPEAWIAVLHAGQRLRFWHVERDEETCAGLLRVAGRFWQRHVIARVPPPVDGAAATAEAIAARYPAVPELTADLTAHVADIDRLRAIRDQQAALKAERAAITNRIKAAMGSAEAGTVRGKTAVTWREHTASRLDQAALAEDHPALHEKYTVTKPQRTFLLSGGKDTDD